MDRIILSEAELEQKFRLAIRLALRKGWLEAALLNVRETEAAKRNKTAAIDQLAKELVEDFVRSKHEVTRTRVTGDGEAILARLLDRS